MTDTNNDDNKVVSFEAASSQEDGELKELTVEEREVLDKMKAALWEKCGELMESGGYESEEKFAYKMGTWVEYQARTHRPQYRQLALLAGQMIQRRFLTVMAAAIKQQEIDEQKGDKTDG